MWATSRDLRLVRPKVITSSLNSTGDVVYSGRATGAATSSTYGLRVGEVRPDGRLEWSSEVVADEHMDGVDVAVSITAGPRRRERGGTTGAPGLAIVKLGPGESCFGGKLGPLDVGGGGVGGADAVVDVGKCSDEVVKSDVR